MQRSAVSAGKQVTKFKQKSGGYVSIPFVIADTHFAKIKADDGTSALQDAGKKKIELLELKTSWNRCSGIGTKTTV